MITRKKKEKQQILTRKSMKNTSTAENGNVNTVYQWEIQWMCCTLLIAYAHWNQSGSVKSSNLFMRIHSLNITVCFPFALMENAKHDISFPDWLLHLSSDIACVSSSLPGKVHPLQGFFHFLKWICSISCLIYLHYHFLLLKCSSYFFWLISTAFLFFS